MATVKTKKEKIREKIFGSMFVVSILFIMITVTYSWFMEGDNASVSNVHMDVEKPSELYFTIGDGDETKQVKELKFEFDKDFKLDAVTGNGKFFYRAELDEKGKVVEYISVSESEYFKKGIFTVDFEMYIDETTPVYLYPESSGDEPIPSGVTGVDSSPQSPYGEFSTKHVSGAIRFAILQADENGEYHPTFIWAPDTASELRTDGLNVSIYEGESDKIYEDYIYVTEILKDQNGQMVPMPQEIKINAGTPAGTVVGTISGMDVEEGNETELVQSVVYAWGPLLEKQVVGNLIGGQHNQFRLAIWVDGNDRECHNALLEGLIFVSLHFGV